MADGVEVSRSIQFVSLDTHPANNALVVTYEILVSIIDAASKRELSRRNKRAQLQVHIKQFDQLGEKDFSKAKIDLGQLSSQIIKNCPLLSASESGQNLEDIHLHLLYLINRRQSSLLANKSPRPASSASIIRPGSRLHSAHAYGARQQSIRLQHSDDDDPLSAAAADIYSFIRAKESRNRVFSFDLAKFEEQFNRQLDSIEALHQPDLANLNLSAIDGAKMDSYLEGLYGDRAERFLSLAIIRRLVVCFGDQSRLTDIASDRLLVCALMRILRDSGVDEYCAREFILCCLMRITTYEDIYLQAFEMNDGSDSASSVDLVKILCDLLAEHVKSRASMQQQEAPGKYHDYLCAILVVFINLFKISRDNPTVVRLEERIFSSSAQNPANFLGFILGDLFQLSARDLMSEIRLMGKPFKVIQMLNANILLLRQLSCLREFIQRIRCKNQLFDSLVTLLNCLQLSRPGSGNPSGSASESVLVRDKQTLNELYHLELNLLMLINNLSMDSRIRSKFIKRKLLKPVLRNLVIFLATSSGSAGNNNNDNYMDTCGWSLILMVPFRSLYELSCDKLVRLELYKSKIIMKCLLEYLLSSGQQELFVPSLKRRASEPATIDGSSSSDWLDGTISIRPTNVAHYTLGVWINLSSLREAPIYSDQELEFKDLLCEYIDLALDKLSSALLGNNQDSMMMNQQEYNLIYLHLKLLRNLSQFMQFTQDELQLYQRCLSKLSNLSGLLFESIGRQQPGVNHNWNPKPYLVESLASLGNLIGAQPCSNYDNMPPALASIFGQLFQFKCENFAGEEDDDLLLVSIRLIGFLANKLEICALPEVAVNQEAAAAANLAERQGINVKILRACNFVLDSKLADYEMIIHTLYSLSQLMNHSQFLKTLLVSSGDSSDVLLGNSTTRGLIDDQEEDQESNLSMLAELLVDKLANLVLHFAPAAGGHQKQQQQPPPTSQGAGVSKVALELLNVFRHLEQQTSIECSFVHKIRFANYNSKWLAAIQASREALESASSSSSSLAGLTSAPPRSGRFARDQVVASERQQQPDAATWFGGNGDQLVLGQTDEDDFGDTRGHGSSSGQQLHRRLPLPLPLQPTMEEREDEDAEEDAEQQDDLNSSGSTSSSFGEAPDLNVIDPNSMIKHLSSRRQLRQMRH